MIKKILIISALFLVLYLSVQYTIGKDSFKSIKSILPPEKQKIIKKYLYPNIYAKQYEPYRYDAKIKNSLDNLIYKKSNEKTLKYKNLKLKLYQNHETFLFGISNTTPGSAYLDIYDNHLFIISSNRSTSLSLLTGCSKLIISNNSVTV